MRTDQSVIIYFNYGIESLDPLHQLEDKLRMIIESENVGDYDGHEIAMDDSDGSLYMFGPNAEKLFKAVKPILVSTHFMKDATAYLRFGSVHDEGVPEIEFEINS